MDQKTKNMWVQALRTGRRIRRKKKPVIYDKGILEDPATRGLYDKDLEGGFSSFGVLFETLGYSSRRGRDEYIFTDLEGNEILLGWMHAMDEFQIEGNVDAGIFELDKDPKKTFFHVSNYIEENV